MLDVVLAPHVMGLVVKHVLMDVEPHVPGIVLVIVKEIVKVIVWGIV